MATVIDAFVVTLGLDASKFNEQQKQSVNYLRQLQESAEKHTKPATKATQDMVGAFKELQGRLLAIGAIIATGLGFNRLVQDITRVNAELGRMSVTFGTTAQQLSEWQQVGRTVGASASEMAAGIAKVNSEIQELRATGNSNLANVMGQVGIPRLRRDDNPDDVLRRINRWYQTQDPAYAQHIMREKMNLPQGMINTLSMKPDKLEAELKRAHALAPTDAEIKKFQELQEAFGRLMNVVDRLTTKALLPFVNALTKILDMLTSWLEKWAKLGQSPPEAAASGLDMMGLHELKPDKKRPSLAAGTWNWLTGKGWYGDQGGDGGSGASNDNNAPAGFQGRFNGTQGGWQTNAQGQSRPAPAGAAGSSTLAAQRAGFERELRENPALRDKVLRIAANEQGRNPQGTQMVIESMMNRAVVRGTNLETQARWYRAEKGGYYEMGNMGRGSLENPGHRAVLEQSLSNALGGSNSANYGTDNSSGALAARERMSGTFRYRNNQNGETFFAPGTAEPGLARRWDQWHQNTTAAEAAAAAGGTQPPAPANEPNQDAPNSRPRVIIPTGNGFGTGGMSGNQRSFENWRNMGLGANGSSIRGGDQSSIDNSQTHSTHVENLHVTPPPGGSPSDYASGIQQRLADFNNVQHANTGMV